MEKKSNFTPVVTSGMTVVGETVDGTQIISGGTAIGTTVINGGVQNVSFGTVSATTIASGGSQDVAGGTVTMTTVSGGGALFVQAGAAVVSVTVKSGGGIALHDDTREVASGGTARAVTLNSGYLIGADTTCVLEAGSVTILNGTASNVTLNEECGLMVSAGGTAIATTVNSDAMLIVLSGGTASNATVNTGGYLMPRPGARVTSATLNGGAIDLSLGTGNFVVDNVTVGSCGGWAGVEDCDTAIGHNLTINNLTGPLEFHLNTDLANNQADTVTINNAVAATSSKLQVNYDPVYPTGKSATGAKVVATVLRGNAGFALMNRQYDEYVYAPTISPSKPGATVWTLTKLAPVPGESEVSSRGGITRPCSEGSMLRRRSNDSK